MPVCFTTFAFATLFHRALILRHPIQLRYHDFSFFSSMRYKFRITANTAYEDSNAAAFETEKLVCKRLSTFRDMRSFRYYT